MTLYDRLSRAGASSLSVTRSMGGFMLAKNRVCVDLKKWRRMRMFRNEEGDERGLYIFGEGR